LTKELPTCNNINMVKLTAFVGLNDKESKVQEIATEVAMTMIQGKVAESFPFGGTVSSAKGVYQHHNGDVVIEESVRIELFLEDSQKDAVNGFLATIKGMLNQESILVEYSTPSVEFI
jgi:hypothetical protein